MSIALTNAATISINGVVQESDPNASLQYIEVVFPSTARFFFSLGNFNSGTQVFTPGTDLPRIVVTLNLETGAWTSSTGASGTLAAASLQSVQGDFITLQNAAESFAVSQSILVGTQTPWVAATEF